MGRYKDLLGREELQLLKRISREDGLELTRVVGAPPDWVEFLLEVGAGTIGPKPGAFKMYPGLVSPEDIYDPVRATGLQEIRIFGDDFQGYCLGFDRKTAWSVVEISPLDGSIDVVTTTFEEYLRSHLLQ